MTLKSGKLILVCFGCSEMLHFDDTRIQALVYSADDATSALPQLRFVGDGITISKGQKVTKGIDKIGLLVETINSDTLVIRTKKLARDYPSSMLRIEELVDAYAALCNIDPAIEAIEKALGKADQWAFALKEIASEGSWNSLVSHLFGSPNALDMAVGLTIWKKIGIMTCFILGKWRHSPTFILSLIHICSSASSCSRGESILHGPHQSA